MARKKSQKTIDEAEEFRILYDGLSDGQMRAAGKNPTRFKPNYHPQAMIDYFQAALDALEEPERFETDKKLAYVTKPVRPPTFSGFAAKVGIHTGRLNDWFRNHKAMDEARGVCKAIQEAVVVEQALLGAYQTGFAALVMKNLHGWQEKIEASHKGGVVLSFDAQDEDA